MKHVLIILIAVLPTLLFGQQEEKNFELPLFKMDLPINEHTGLISFVYVVEVNDVPKDELYSRAVEWINVKYNAEGDILQMEDKEKGMLIGYAFTDMTIIEVGLGEIEKMYYSIKIFVRDGRYKCVITDIRFQSYASEYDLYPDIFSAEHLMIDELYNKKGKIRSKNMEYKEKTITAVRSLAQDLQNAMVKEKYAAEGDEW